MLATTNSVATAQVALDWRNTFACTICLTLLWALSFVGGARRGAFVWGTTLVIGALAITTRLLPVAGVVSEVRPHVTPWGETVTAVVHGAPSPLAPLFLVTFLAVNVYGLHVARRVALRDRAGAIGIAVAATLHLITVPLMSPAIVQASAQWLYVGTLPYAVWALLLTLQTSRDAEAARRRLDAQLLRAQTLESVGQLAAGIVHDFNNLLTVINGYAELLTKTSGAPSPEAIEIRQAGERAAALTSQLLAYSRRRRSDSATFDASGVVRDAERLLRRLVGREIQMHVETDVTPATVRGDGAQFERAVLNLVLNARDAMPAGGTLHIRTRVTQAGPPHEKVASTTGRVVIVEVADTGVGITTEAQAQLFEPFFTTKATGKGTGLGLVVVAGFVQSHSGTVGVESLPGRGSTFRMVLPWAEPIQVARSGEQGGMFPRGTEVVLVVDDDMAIRRLVADALGAKGYTVVAAATPADAIVATTERPRIDLLLADVATSGTSAPNLVEALRKRSPGVRVLYMSAHAADEMTRLGLVQGETPLLEKPFTLGALAEHVRRVLDQPTLKHS